LNSKPLQNDLLQLYGKNDQSTSADEICLLFNRCFGEIFGVEILGGADEPVYLPASDPKPAQLIFRANYAASALHEAAHWCIAGSKRRGQIDFGLIYICEPRTQEQQQRFFSAEVRTQSLECNFASAANLAFNPSADNLNCDVQIFAEAIKDFNPKTLAWLESKAGARALKFRDALLALNSADR
jgi:hypothetical protein